MKLRLLLAVLMLCVLEWSGLMGWYAQAQITRSGVMNDQFNIPVDANNVPYPITARSGAGSTCTDVTLNTAITAIGSTRATLPLVPRDGAQAACSWTLSGNVTTNANTYLLIEAPVVVNAGFTLTINGPWLSTIGPNWYSGAGTVTINYREPTVDALSSFIVSGCNPEVPAPASLTLGAFACRGNITTNGQWHHVNQAAAAVGPLNAGNGTYWLALHRDSTSAIGGWTRQAGTNYLWQFSSSRPSEPTGGMIFREVTVAAGAITAVPDWRQTNPTQSRTFLVTSPIFGTVIPDDALDDHVGIQAALTKLRPYDTLVFPPGDYRIGATLALTTSQVTILADGARWIWTGVDNGTVFTGYGVSDLTVKGLWCRGATGSVDPVAGASRCFVAGNANGVAQHTNRWHFLDVRAEVLKRNGTDAAFDGSGQCGIANTCGKLQDSIFSHVLFSGGNVGMKASRSTLTFLGGIFAGATNGLRIQTSSQVVMFGSSFAVPLVGGNGTAAIGFEGDNTAGCTIDVNEFYKITVEGYTNTLGFTLGGCATLTIQAINFYGPRLATGIAGGNFIDLTSVATSLLLSRGMINPGSAGGVVVPSGSNLFLDRWASGTVSPTGAGVISTFTGSRFSLSADTLPAAYQGYSVDGSIPASLWRETGVAANNQIWRRVIDGGILHEQVALDDQSATVDWITVTRSANSISAIDMPLIALTPGVTFANLGTPPNYTLRGCTDCLHGSNPCVGGSVGAIAKRLNNTWVCN